MAGLEDTQVWCAREISALMGLDGTEIARHLVAIENVEQLRVHARELLGGTPDALSIGSELERRLLLRQGVAVPAGMASARAYVKPGKDDVVYMAGKSKAQTGAQQPQQQQQQQQQQQKGSKKTRYVEVDSEEGRRAVEGTGNGRARCDCEASRHGLIGNCRSCGRIVCEQEGAGPCMFCGEPVYTREQREIIDRNSRKSQKLKDKLTKSFADDPAGGTDESLERAKALRDRLLEYARSGAKRTRVYDDESDYFQADGNRWLSEEQRKALKQYEADARARREAARKEVRVTLDFAGRRILEDNPTDRDDLDLYSPAAAEVAEILVGEAARGAGTVDPRSVGESMPAPVYVRQKSDAGSAKGKAVRTAPASASSGTARVQDRLLNEMADTGACLSMHQPWASLLVHGIKRVEGRTWYSSHRGRLWIAAAAKEPTGDVVEAVQEQYRRLRGDPHLAFPEYPTACLLGCVDVVDCLTQEEYAQSQTDGDGESESPYVFVCENPQSLPLKLPVKGQHKIWKLERRIHDAARQGLLHLRTAGTGEER